jgi:hypothetical protein
MLIFNYMVRVDGKISLGAIATPPTDFPAIGDALKLTYAHELEVTRSIYSILDVALEEKDHKTTAFLLFCNGLSTNRRKKRQMPTTTLRSSTWSEMMAGAF